MSGSMAHNVFGLVAVGDFEKLLFSLLSKLIRSHSSIKALLPLLLQTLVSGSGLVSQGY